jgi:hypothetical protein
VKAVLGEAKELIIEHGETERPRLVDPSVLLLRHRVDVQIKGPAVVNIKNARFIVALERAVCCLED